MGTVDYAHHMNILMITTDYMVPTSHNHLSVLIYYYQLLDIKFKEVAVPAVFQ